MAYFISSDFHAFHTNICKGVSSWNNKDNATRDFHTVEEMNEVLLNAINFTVKQDDTLYFLGDFAFGNAYNVYAFRRRIICKNIIFILGNHDKAVRDNKPISLKSGENILPRSLFTEVCYYKKISINKQEFILNHYAYRVWDGSHRGSINCYGHSHSSLPPIGRQIDVGIDNAFKLLGEYRPFSFEEIIKDVNTRNVVIVDHHNHKTT